MAESCIFRDLLFLFSENVIAKEFQFCITFSDGSNEYPPVIYNKTNPCYLISNGTNTSGSGNDVINLTSGLTSYTVNIYQTTASTLPLLTSYTVSVTLTTL